KEIPGRSDVEIVVDNEANISKAEQFKLRLQHAHLQKSKVRKSSLASIETVTTTLTARSYASPVQDRIALSSTTQRKRRVAMRQQLQNRPRDLRVPWRDIHHISNKEAVASECRRFFRKQPAIADYEAYC